jgi:F-type H+-transporting ATPase subunit delta
MLENATVARPYAQAVFEEARDRKQLGEWSDTLAYLSAIVSDPQMRRVLTDPRIERAQKERLVFDVGGDHVNAAGKNLVRVLLDAGRVLIVPDIAIMFEQFKAQTEGKVDVAVVSAFALEAEQERIIADAVKQRVGKAVSIKTSIDPSLIGGVIVRVGDMVTDASIRGRLKQLANRFI